MSKCTISNVQYPISDSTTIEKTFSKGVGDLPACKKHCSNVQLSNYQCPIVQWPVSNHPKTYVRLCDIKLSNVQCPSVKVLVTFQLAKSIAAMSNCRASWSPLTGHLMNGAIGRPRCCNVNYIYRWSSICRDCTAIQTDSEVKARIFCAK